MFCNTCKKMFISTGIYKHIESNNHLLRDGEKSIYEVSEKSYILIRTIILTKVEHNYCSVFIE